MASAASQRWSPKEERVQQYLARRLLQLIPTLLLVSLLIFFVMRILPGDVATLVATGGAGSSEGSSLQIDPDQLLTIRESLGLDAPLWLQYLQWMQGVVTLDWGESLFNQRSVGAEIRQRLPVTLELALLTSLLAVAVGIPLGVLSALRRNSWIDYLVRLLALGGLSIPNFWLATLLLIGGLYFFGWIPRIEYVGLSHQPLDNLRQFIWPALVLSSAAAAIISRMTRSSLLEVLHQDYIRTAWAKGLRSRQVLYRHALKNALLPVVTIIGILFITLASGSVIMEQIFVLPGLGLYLLDGVRFRDYTVVQSLMLLYALGVLLINLVVDITYAWLDPRIRYR